MSTHTDLLKYVEYIQSALDELREAAGTWEARWKALAVEAAQAAVDHNVIVADWGTETLSAMRRVEVVNQHPPSTAFPPPDALRAAALALVKWQETYIHRLAGACQVCCRSVNHELGPHADTCVFAALKALLEAKP